MRDTYTLINHSGACVDLRRKGIITMADCACPYSVTIHDAKNITPSDVDDWANHKGGKEGKHQSYSDLVAKFFRRVLPSQPKGQPIVRLPPRESKDWKVMDRKLSHLVTHKASPEQIANIARKRARRKLLAEQ